MTKPDVPAIIKLGYIEVRNLTDGRKLLVLPSGKRDPNLRTWYELTPEQAAWLAAELVK